MAINTLVDHAHVLAYHDLQLVSQPARLTFIDDQFSALHCLSHGTQSNATSPSRFTALNINDYHFKKKKKKIIESRREINVTLWSICTLQLRLMRCIRHWRTYTVDEERKNVFYRALRGFIWYYLNSGKPFLYVNLFTELFRHSCLRLHNQPSAKDQKQLLI